MQAKQKSNSIATSSFALATGVLTLSVIDALGKGKPGELAFDVRKFAGEAAYDGLTPNGKRAIGHGMNQRLMDRAAKGRDKKTGKSATPAEKFEAIKALAEHLNNGGEWALKGGGAQPKPLDRAALYMAVALVRNAKPEQVEKLYAGKPDEVLRTLLTIAAIAAEYAKLTAPSEDAKAKELMDELEGEMLLSEVEDESGAQPGEGDGANATEELPVEEKNGTEG